MLVLEAIRIKEEQLSDQRHVLETLTGLEDQVRGGAASARWLPRCLGCWLAGWLAG